MAIRIRPTKTLDEFHDATGAISHYFGAGLFDADRSTERSERFMRLLPFDRMHAAFEDGVVVGGAGSFPFELTVPGGPVACRTSSTWGRPTMQNFSSGICTPCSG